MAQGQSPVAVMNNFTAGLKTEFTGLNFPENACTDTDNCIFTLIGDVVRRPGIDYEDRFQTNRAVRVGTAISNFIWTNAGGDGNTKIYVQQEGGLLFFYNITNTTDLSPLSANILTSTIDLNNFYSGGGVFPQTFECEYASGNGYLFVYNPAGEPFYCVYDGGFVTATLITLKIRDFEGVDEGIPDNLRPGALSDPHKYNLQNQGWTSQAPWAAASSSNVTLSLGAITFVVPSGLPITLGTAVSITGQVTFGGSQVNNVTMIGSVTSYVGTSLTIQVTSITPSYYSGFHTVTASWSISPSNATGQINTWFTAVGNYPSNADVWWTFKNSSGVFDPATTLNNVTLNSGPAPKGYYILRAFVKERGGISSTSIPDTVVTARPKTGTWFAGRVWYTGIDNKDFTENILFSQIIIKPNQFGLCYQINDPTSETLSDLLPTDGGVIKIQGCGSIYKLFPVQNGMLVFAANGIWFITGGTSVGFTANDYTITKISGIRSISCTSFVDVNGLPIFWNEEGIYEVTPAAQDKRNNEQLGLSVTPLTLGTILSFYNEIPSISKKYVRGSYNPITYIVKWVFKSTMETSILDRYQFDRVLNYNIANKAFYPYSVSTGGDIGPSINGVVYIEAPGSTNSPAPTFKYLTSVQSTLSNPDGSIYDTTFAEERDTDAYVDWKTFDGEGVDFTSFFVTGYSLKGQAVAKFQPMYVYMYHRNISIPNAYTIQGIWSYAIDPNSGRYSSLQTFNNNRVHYDKGYRRIRIRGHGHVLQYRVSSVPGLAFDIMGWATIDDVDAGI